MTSLPPSEFNPRVPSIYDPRLVIEEDEDSSIIKAYYNATTENSRLAEIPESQAERDKVLLLKVDANFCTMYPINVRRDKHDYLKPKYGTLTSITLESEFFGLPTTVEAVAELLTELPEGFSKQFQYGLGLKWEYRFIPQTVSNIPSINALIIDESKEVRIDGNRYILGLPRYHQLRRALKYHLPAISE